MHMLLTLFANRLAVLDKLVASAESIVLYKEELRLTRMAMHSHNWPGRNWHSTSVVRKDARRVKASPTLPVGKSTVMKRVQAYARKNKLSEPEKLAFLEVHLKTLQAKLKSFNTIVGIVDRRSFAAVASPVAL